MRHWPAVLWLGTLGCAANALVTQTGSDPLGRIDELAQRRSLSDGQLEQLAAHQAPEVRARAVRALGQIQDATSAPTLVRALSDAVPEVRTEAAFAVSLLALSWQPLPDEVKRQLASAVLAAESTEQNEAVHLELLASLGRLATAETVERLAERLTGAATTQAQAALMLGIAVKNGAKLPDTALASLMPLVAADVDTELRYPAVYALAQAKAASAAPALLSCTRDESSEVRALCAKALGDVGGDEAVAALAPLLADNDWRVAVESTRALAKRSGRCTGPSCQAAAALNQLTTRAERLLRGEVADGAQPLLALAQQGPGRAGRGVLLKLRELLSGNTSLDATNIDCRLAAAVDRIDGALREVRTCGAGKHAEAYRLWLGLSELAKEANAFDATELLSHPSARVKNAALEVIAVNHTLAAVPSVRPLLANADAVLAANAALTLAKLNDVDSLLQVRRLATRALREVDVAPVVAEALIALKATQARPELEAWLRSSHATVRHQAAAALTELTGARVSAANLERDSGPTPPPVAPNTRLRIQTEKGAITVALFDADAPLTAASMVALAQKHFFDGLTFHRVVGDFVVQGGDPRGDGEGGPGYQLPCEVNRRPYQRGTVGMALSGKDTGGSQFFITHTPTPHLNGRYTVFGEVIDGQSVADALLEGDRIATVTVETQRL